MSRQDNTQIVDPFLLQILEQRREENGLSDILRSIQDEQNKIMDFDFMRNLIVQGCAGSGKTMILLHRLANILYNIKELPHRISPERIVVIIPNDNFKDYINELSWSLGVNKIRMMTFDEYLGEKVGDVLMSIFKDDADDGISKNTSLQQAKKDKKYYERHPMELIITETIQKIKQNQTDVDSAIGFGEKKRKQLAKFINEYYAGWKSLYDSRKEERDRRQKNLRPSERSKHNAWLKKSLAPIRQYRKEGFLTFKNMFLRGELSRKYLVGFLTAICEDEQFVSYRPKTDDLLMIDEGQDYGFREYRALKLIEPNCIFNIFGDTDQKIFKRGLDSWDEIVDLLAAEFFELNQDYRNSNQIVEFVNQRLGKKMQPIGFDTKDVEIIPRAKLPVYLRYEDKFLKHRIAIVKSRWNEFSSAPDNIKVLSVPEIKGLEFDAVFVPKRILELNNNFTYVALTRALSDLYIIED